MRKSSVALALAASLLVLLPAPAHAWFAKGHKTVAYIAYDELKPATRKRVNAVLKRHPEYAEWVKNMPAADRGREAFMRASVWPDDIKQYAGYKSSQKCVNTPSIGFQDKGKHNDWHYLDIPFSSDGTPTKIQCAPNAYSIIVRFSNELSSNVSDDIKAYDLTWLIHLIGDIHQPMHGTARFSASDTDGDGGGNDLKIERFRLRESKPGDFPAENLHSFWDGSLGEDSSPQAVRSLAESLTAEIKPENPRPRPNKTRVWQWINESGALGRYFAYTLEMDRNTKDVDGDGRVEPVVGPEYERFAVSIARQRMALAGYRLADLINTYLK